jgi:hypothetical protein
MALVLALIALVLMGALAAAICFVGIQEARVGENVGRLERSFGVVEEGGAEVVRQWDPKVQNARQPFPFDSGPVPAGYPRTWAATRYGTGAYGGYVYKLNGELYFIDMTGRDSLGPGQGAGSAPRQHVGLLTHVRPVEPGIEASLTTGKGSRPSGLVTVDSSDRVPPDWAGCGPPDSGKGGVRTLTGTPPVPRLGDVTYSQLAAWATHTLPGQAFGDGIGPVVVDGRCDDAVAINWGDGKNPDRPCGTFFPVVHITGDATMGELQGQGILFVDGSLVVRGGLEWFGVVLVRGRLTLVGDVSNEIAIWGAVMADDSVLLQGPAGGSIAIRYSKCAITKALETIATVAMLRARGWVSLSDAP